MRPLLPLACLLLAGCTTSGIAWESLDQGQQSGVQMEDAGMRVLADQEAWERFWMEHAGGRERPPVDFASRLIVAVFMGQQPSSGHDIEVKNVKQVDDGILVEAVGREPGGSCGTLTVITHPFHIVAVERVAGVGEAELSLRTVAYTCE